jgi:hypothetical protein
MSIITNMLTEVEVFTYDNGKTFGYDINSGELSIRKINKHIAISLGNSSLSINEKYKFVCAPTANVLKNIFNYFELGQYKNTKESKIELLLFFKTLEDKILVEQNRSTFLNYSQTNESYLDILDEKEQNSVQYKKAESDIINNNKILKKYFIENIL